MFPNININFGYEPKNIGITQEITSLISEYKNNLQHVDSNPNNLTESQEEIIYLISRAIKKHLESNYYGRAMTNNVKSEMENEIRHILNEVIQLNPIDNKLKWECIQDIYNGSVTLRAYIYE